MGCVWGGVGDVVCWCGDVVCVCVFVEMGVDKSSRVQGRFHIWRGVSCQWVLGSVDCVKDYTR